MWRLVLQQIRTVAAAEFEIFLLVTASSSFLPSFSNVVPTEQELVASGFAIHP
jgi:hypothetical protein